MILPFLIPPFFIFPPSFILSFFPILSPQNTYKNIKKIPQVLGYGKLVEKFAHKEYILYLILGLWSILFFFIGIAALFVDVTQSGTTAGEVLGWFTFFSVETFGSLSIAGLCLVLVVGVVVFVEIIGG